MIFQVCFIFEASNQLYSNGCQTFWLTPRRHFDAYFTRVHEPIVGYDITRTFPRICHNLALKCRSLVQQEPASVRLESDFPGIFYLVTVPLQTLFTIYLVPRPIPKALSNPYRSQR